MTPEQLAALKAKYLAKRADAPPSPRRRVAAKTSRQERLKPTTPAEWAQRRHLEESCQIAKRISRRSPWRLLAVIMVVQERECVECGSLYTFPQSELFLQRKHIRWGVVDEAPASAVGLIPPHLPRLIRRIRERGVVACPSCYQSTEQLNQPQLFDPVEEYPTWVPDGWKQFTESEELNRQLTAPHTPAKGKPRQLTDNDL